MAGEVAIDVAFAPDNPLERLEGGGFAVFIHKGEQGSNKLLDAGRRLGDLFAQVIENGLYRIDKLLGGHEAGQAFASVREQDVVDEANVAGGAFNIGHDSADHEFSRVSGRSC